MIAGLVKVQANDAVSNPDAVIDIVVNIPADYPGTFLDFKEELTEKLIAQGLDENKFRIISSAIKIDTTDTSGWYVYDHYYDQSTYNSLGLDSTKQPYRAADNSHVTGNITTIEQEFATTTPTTCRKFKRHISSTLDEAGKAKMTFAGYGTQPLADFMIYPAPSNSRRTFSFDIDAKGVGNHTLTGVGFFVNAGINGTSSSATVNGYLLFYEFSTQVSGNIYLIPMSNVNAMNFQTSNVTGLYSKAIAKDTFNLGSSKKARIDVDLQSKSLTVQQRNYTSSGTFEEIKTLFGGKAVAMEATGYNGFGPMAAYKSHGCSQLSSFVFSDLEMNYEANAFDALKNVQYAEDADYKYFINLAGTNADPGVPEDKENYLEGVKRLNENKIFYISNVDDGKILKDPTADSSGIGPDNGLYATDQDYVSQIAEYIANNYKDNVKFKHVDLQEEKQNPIADFSICENRGTDEERQILTVHLQHMQTSTDKIVAQIKDKSIPSDSGAKITQWSLKVYDPDNSIVANSGGFVNSPELLPNYTFTKESKQGKYTFELVVKDEDGNESSTFQTYLTAYKDDKAAAIEAASEGYKSSAHIALVDKGYGIDRDGVTLIEDEGSGILKYQVNDGEVITLNAPVHAYNFSQKLTADPLKVTSWDECGNQSTNTFNTVSVSFEDDLYDTYYVLENGKLGELPEAPKNEDPNQIFQGWADADGNLVSSETVVSDDIVLHPVYTTEKVQLTFSPNGGSFGDSQESKVIEVPKGSNVIDHLLSGDELPTKEGYHFTYWTYNSAQITTQKANSDMTLVANWAKDLFTLKFDANGGNLGKLKEKSVEYGANIVNAVTNDETGSPYQGTYLPTREGYTFQGWAKDKNGTAIGGSETMPAGTYTVYAKWQKDTSRYIVHFDSNGGSTVNDKSYPTTTANYGTLNTPNRSGYTFEGWYDEGGTLRESGDTVYKQADHTLTAKWSANTNTQYKLEYWFSTENGYVRNDDLTVVRYGTTDEQVSIKDGDIKDFSGYWYDEGSELNKLSGTISGDGKLTLKIYYNRYLSVSTSKDGSGTITPSKTMKEGSDYTVNWTPAKGYVVGRVFVDDVIRDDLLVDNKIEFKDINKNHKVYVEFVKEGGSSGSGSTDIGETGYYQVKTKIDGPIDAGTITPTKTVAKNSDYAVDWTINEGYYITSIKVDGKEYPLDTKNVDFKGIKADHEVIVTVESLPGLGGGSTTGYYTVTVNKYGGDETTKVSGNQVVNSGDNATVTWESTGEYKIAYVFVDGKEISQSVINSGKYDFSNITQNHVVDVYFQKDGSGDGDWQKDPVTITTQLIGGPGTISSGGIVSKGSDFTVTWDPILQVGNSPSDSDYAVYEIDKVLVNYKVYDTKGQNKIEFNSIKSNQDVKVYMKPVIYAVDTLKYGDGTVDVSKVLYKGQSYLNIEGTPNSGSVVSKLVVDGVDYPITGITTLAANEVEVTKQDKTGISVNVNDISKNHEIEVYFTADGGSLPGDEDLISVTGEIIGATGEIDGTGIFEKGDDDTVSWNIDGDYKVVDVKVNGESVSFSGNSIDLKDLQGDKDVDIYVEKNSLPGNDDVQDGKGDNPLYDINTSIVGGPGTITNSGKVEEGSSSKVEWEVTDPDNYEIRDVIVDGVSRPDLISPDGKGEITFDDINKDHKVEVIVGKKPELNVDVDGDDIPDVNIDTDKDGKPDINIDLNGDGKPEINIDTDNKGTWKPSGNGGNSDGIWKPDTKLDTDGDGKVDTDHLYRPGKDTDGDGVDDYWKPSIDVYPDGIGNPGYDTGHPNLDYDKDGDGNPDINIDTNGDGKPNVDIDTDGDLNPDINIDTDGDKKPDINIDTDGDGNPDINIDTDGDGNPDINIDTDGDGNPDINIDTDGDGKPDINIDTDGDGNPDVNIDLDGDGIPDANIDTDGDGIADYKLLGDTPATSDSSNVLLWIVMFVISGGFITYLQYKRKEETSLK